VAQAGRLGAVTIATNMAGRGTDIVLGGNPEYIAKQRLREKGYSGEVVAEASEHFPTEDQKVLEAREEYLELLEEARPNVKESTKKLWNSAGCLLWELNAMKAVGSTTSSEGVQEGKATLGRPGSMSH